jgi:hypothetical protein
LLVWKIPLNFPNHHHHTTTTTTTTTLLAKKSKGKEKPLKKDSHHSTPQNGCGVHHPILAVTGGSILGG